MKEAQGYHREASPFDGTLNPFSQEALTIATSPELTQAELNRGGFYNVPLGEQIRIVFAPAVVAVTDAIADAGNFVAQKGSELVTSMGGAMRKFVSEHPTLARGSTASLLVAEALGGVACAVKQTPTAAGGDSLRPTAAAGPVEYQDAGDPNIVSTPKPIPPVSSEKSQPPANPAADGGEAGTKVPVSETKLSLNETVSAQLDSLLTSVEARSPSLNPNVKKADLQVPAEEVKAALAKGDIEGARKSLRWFKAAVYHLGDPTKGKFIPKEIRDKYDPQGLVMKKTDDVDPAILDLYLAVVKMEIVLIGK